VASRRFIVIGGGIAGLRAAIALAPVARVTVLTKDQPSESNTGYAQGGIAAAFGPDDSPALHAADTIRAGDGLCDEEAVRVLVENGPVYVRELLDWGARFDRDASGRPALGREAAHSVSRVLHAGDATGREIGRVLWARVAATRSIEVLTHALATDLIVEGGAVAGVRYVDQGGAPRELRGDATLLATGGAGCVFSETTNPPVATGDGIALAFRAGARVADLEFVQFHPTALRVPGAPRFLISEAVRGDGARLVNSAGERFMARYHPDGELAPRDVVARSIELESRRTGGPVALTLAHLDAEYVRRRFPSIAAMCAGIGLDLARDPIPVGPAAHYVMGGVDTDLDGRTSVAGLFAAGEVACTGVHGANRLASNSLLEGLVFGARAAAAMLEPARAAGLRPGRVVAHSFERCPAGDRAPVRAADIRELMWRSVGVFRSRPSLQHALAALEGMGAGGADASAVNLVTVARVIAAAALRREESRGGHFREDFPRRDDIHWKVHVCDELSPG
jgi:L-aspartate oxidase